MESIRVIMQSTELNYKLLLEVWSQVVIYQGERLQAETHKLVAKRVIISTCIINFENKFCKWNLINNHAFYRRLQYQKMKIIIRTLYSCAQCCGGGECLTQNLISQYNNVAIVCWKFKKNLTNQTPHFSCRVT